jgi:hypothetical protein
MLASYSFVPTLLLPSRNQTSDGAGSVSTYIYDRIVEEEQQDTPAPAGTFCSGIPELESSKMKVASRERTRSQTLGHKKNEQMMKSDHRDD